MACRGVTSARPAEHAAREEPPPRSITWRAVQESNLCPWSRDSRTAAGSVIGWPVGFPADLVEPTSGIALAVEDTQIYGGGDQVTWLVMMPASSARRRSRLRMRQTPVVRAACVHSLGAHADGCGRRFRTAPAASAKGSRLALRRFRLCRYASDRRAREMATAAAARPKTPRTAMLQGADAKVLTAGGSSSSVTENSICVVSPP